MPTTAEAFEKFRKRLELSETERRDAAKRHTEVRDCIRAEFDITNDFLSGSYRRHTKTKPLKDVDVMFVMGEKEKHRRSKPPSGPSRYSAAGVQQSRAHSFSRVRSLSVRGPSRRFVGLLWNSTGRSRREATIPRNPRPHTRRTPRSPGDACTGYLTLYSDRNPRSSTSSGASTGPSTTAGPSRTGRRTSWRFTPI